MKNKCWIFGLLASLFILSGCENSKSSSSVDTIEVYDENTTIYKLQEEQYPFTILDMSKDYFYFTCTHMNEDNSNNEIVDIYRRTFDDSDDLKFALPSVNQILRCTYIEPDELNQDITYLLVGEEINSNILYKICKYSKDAKLTSETSLEATFAFGDYPISFIKLKDGYSLLSKKCLYLFDWKGMITDSANCPKDDFRGLVQLSEDKIAVTYYDEQLNATYISVYNMKTGDFTGETKIFSAGTILCKNNDNILYIGEKGIYQYNVSAKNAEEILSLENRNIDIHQIKKINVENDTIKVLGYGSDITAIKYISFTKRNQSTDNNSENATSDSSKYDHRGRRYIYLYDYAGQWPNEAHNPIDAFNEQSDTYQVVLKDYEYAHIYDEDYDIAKIVASEDYPDMIFSSYNSLMSSFLEKGVLENLYNYINNSDQLSIEELSQPVVNAYTKNGILFALPNRYRVQAYFGDKNRLKEPGWTVSEFLDFIKEYPESCTIMGTRKDVFDACINGVFQICYNNDKGKVDFTGEYFHNFINQLKSLNRRDTYYTLEELEEIKRDASICIRYTTNLNTISLEENENGTEFIIKGYPSEDGKPIAYIDSPALSIMSTSEVKEGAYEFMEFYIKYQNDIIDSVMTVGGSDLWTYNTYLEKNIDALLKADYYMDKPCTFSKEQIDKVLAILPYIRIRDDSLLDLENVIWEELVPFLDNQKTADEVCDIIQKKAKLYYSERTDY